MTCRRRHRRRRRRRWCRRWCLQYSSSLLASLPPSLPPSLPLSVGGRTDGRSVDVGGGLESFFVRSAAVAAVATVDVVITLVRCSMEGERERTNTTAVGGERERTVDRSSAAQLLFTLRAETHSDGVREGKAGCTKSRLGNSQTASKRGPMNQPNWH